MTNLVILYTGNVGSTPLVQVAARHPRIFVPVHEDFDSYKFTPFSSEESRCRDLAETLDALYRRRNAPYLDTEIVRGRRAGDALPAAGSVPHVVFKWRTDGYEPRRPGADALSQVFRTHAALPVVLARRSVVEQALKVWLSEAQYGGRHQQFRASALSEEDYAAYLREQDSISIPVDTAGLRSIREIATRFLVSTNASIRAARVHFAHAGLPRLLVSEQVLTPDIDYGRVSTAYSALLGEPVDLSPDMAPKVRRGGLGTEHCANLRQVALDRGLRRIEARYQRLLAGLPLVLPARRPVPLPVRLARFLVAPPVPLGPGETPY